MQTAMRPGSRVPVDGACSTTGIAPSATTSSSPRSKRTARPISTSPAARVETVVAEGVDGDVIEAGAWRGGAAILTRATLDTLGDGRTVWVADSFRGFPEGAAADDGSPDLSAFDFLAVPLDEVRESSARLGCERGVRFLPGFFADSLPGLAGERWAIVRLDADSYDATREG